MTAAVALGALVAPGATAHVTVQPTASRPADLQRYRVIVPNERSKGDTTGVDLRLPSGVTFALVEAAPGWRTRVVKRGSAISEIHWSGGRVPPGGYAELRFIARNPVRVGDCRVEGAAALRRRRRRALDRLGGTPSSRPPSRR